MKALWGGVIASTFVWAGAACREHEAAPRANAPTTQLASNSEEQPATSPARPQIYTAWPSPEEVADSVAPATGDGKAFDLFMARWKAASPVRLGAESDEPEIRAAIIKRDFANADAGDVTIRKIEWLSRDEVIASVSRRDQTFGIYVVARYPQGWRVRVCYGGAV